MGLNHIGIPSPFNWTAPSNLDVTHYFACGLENGSHCRTDGGDMRAAITVRESCNSE